MSSRIQGIDITPEITMDVINTYMCRVPVLHIKVW